jgi:hypothetical protein
MNALLRLKQTGGIMGQVLGWGMDFFEKNDKRLKWIRIVFREA